MASTRNPDGTSGFIFDEILRDGFIAGQTDYKQAAAIEWYKRKLSRMYRTDNSIAWARERDILTEGAKAKRTIIQPIPGRMYMWVYDPKYKETLPYYDNFPLGLVVDYEKGGFTALNFHYCPLPYRAKLLSALFKVTNMKGLNRQMQMKISYNLLKSASNLRAFKPCFKRYLYGHARSRFVEIYPAEWATAIWMPVARFQKKTERAVHMESKRIIGS